MWCRGCGLLELPEGLDAASALETLDVGENFLRFVSDRFGGATLANLKRLNVSENALTRLPAALKHSPALTHLDASGNRLSDARDGVGCLGNGCVALEELRLARNQLETLPRDVAGGPARLLRALGGGGGRIHRRGGGGFSGFIGPRGGVFAVVRASGVGRSREPVASASFGPRGDAAPRERRV